jgi:MinD-like ATPase involved in chromosome partitioning or flagellar assembly
MARAENPVITFYSYKGGTGRTATLANVAWLLASSGQKVCALDWDLEAPGLHRYFRPFLEDADLELTDGLVDWLWEISAVPLTPPSSSEYRPSILDYVIQIDWDFGKDGALDFLPAGRQDSDYAKRVNSFEWANFYERLGGAQTIINTRKLLKEKYDFVLIDSRTGVSDISGICTIEMPDRLVACYTLNRQSIEGVDNVLTSIRKQRDGKRPLDILPLEMRIDTSEKQKLEAARAVARPRFNRYLSKEAAPSYWESMEVLYWPFCSFEECLAAFGDVQENRSSISLLSAMERVARRVSRIPDIEATPVDPKTRKSVLARYALGTSGGQTEDSLATGPQIFSEAFVRYQEWTRNQVPTKLLSRKVLQQLDNAGPLPRSLREDSQFMAYLVQSRDYQAKEQRQGAIIAMTAGSTFAIAALVTSFVGVSGDARYGLWAVAAFCGLGVLGGLLQLVEWTRLGRRTRPGGDGA